MDAVDIDTVESPQNEEDPVESTVDVCRICLIGNLIMRDIFVDGDVVSLSTKAMSFASVKIVPGDGLPSQVCCECADKLESAYEFKLQVEQADSVLRERFVSLNIKEELFFNEVEVHLDGGRTDDVTEIDVDAQYEAAAETLHEDVVVDDDEDNDNDDDDDDDDDDEDKSASLIKDHLALLQVEKLAAQERQHVLDENTIVQETDDIQEVIMKEHILQSEEQYVHDGVQCDEQLIGEEIESSQCENNMKAEVLQEAEEGIMIEEHNYIIQQDYTLSSEQEQELMNQESDANDQDTAEYLSMIGEDETEAKDAENDMTTLERDKSDECEREVCEQEQENEELLKARKSRRKSSRRKATTVAKLPDEDNYFENLNLSSRLSRYHVEKSDKIFFMCYLCDKQFLSKDVLKEHMHSHEEVRRTLCQQKKTPEKTPQKNILPVQKGQPPSGKKANKCPYCGKEYLYVISFNKHVKQHQKNDDKIKEFSDNSIQHDQSNEFDDFDNNDTFEIITSEIDDNDEEYNNENGNEYTVDENSSRKRNNMVLHTCDKCPEEFTSKSDLKQHSAQHTLVKCNTCDEEFDSLDKLHNHRPTHIIEGLITEQDLKDELVNMCSKEYSEDNEQLEQIDDNEMNHMEYSNKELNEHKCPNCSSIFNTKKLLSKHLETHENVRYRCKICGDEFTRKDHLRKHAEQHQRVKTFKCTECNKTFGNELTLRNHLIATNHKTILHGEEYDPNKRIKRVAAKAAQKIIDKISTEDGLDDSERDDDNDEFVSKIDVTGSGKSGERLQSSSRKSSNKKDLECATCGKRCISKQALAKHMEYHVKNEKSENLEKAKNNIEMKGKTRNCIGGFGDERDDDDDDDDDDFDGGLDWPMDNHECTTCKKRYSTKKSLLRHQLLHEEPNFECDICNVKFYRKDKLKAHYDKCSEKNPNQVRKCNICGDTFENNEILREHRSKHVDEGILTEEDLRELEPGSEERKRGEKIARKRRTDIVGLECTECNKQYTSRKGLLRHIQVHEGKKYLCDICPKKFYRREHLKIHVAKHNMVKPYKCTRCSKRFIKEEQLAAHLTKHERTFKKNKETDSSAKRFLCEICSKSFTQSTTLVAHLRAHNGIKPYVCEVCARPFTTNAYLKMHMRTHTQERPYSCQYCARAFARADTLANHLTSHTGEAKYHCKYCPKNFRRLKSLKEHVFIHTGQRPYACPTCDRRFNNNGSRYAHSKRCKQNMLQNQMRQSQNQTQTTTQTTIVQQPQSPIQQTIRLAQAVGPTMQVVQSKNIKTITITRHPDQVGTHQVMQHQEILMPLILPLAVTLADVDEEVILPEGTKIFTTT